MYGDSWMTQIDEGAVMSELSVRLGLHFGQKLAGGEVEYIISDIDVNVINTPFAPSGNSERFEAEVFLTLTVATSFGWEHVPAMVIEMKVNAGYTPKF